MVVQHNLTAMNANRMLGITQGVFAKSTEKLSSGYKINRAADDAAGLSISEKMRKQIRGLTQASLNAQDGISAVQTAEGALTEVHDMLQRLNELAVQASNGTLAESDRQNIQDEVDQVLTEIDRVAETTKFNEMYLLKGDSSKQKEVKMFYHDAGLTSRLTGGFELPVSKKYDSVLSKRKYDNSSRQDIDYDEFCREYTLDDGLGVVNGSLTQWSEGDKIIVGGVEYILTMQGESADRKSGTPYQNGSVVNALTLQKIILAELRAANSIGTDPGANLHIVFNYTQDGELNKDIENLTLENRKSAVRFQIRYDDKKNNIHSGYATTNADFNFSLHVGADADMTNKIAVNIECMNTTGLGIRNLKVMGSTSEYTPANGTMATYAIDAIDDAIYRVSQTRSRLGAIQNRLEHSIKNLDNVVENTTAAESQIRDTDMATEMVKYSNTNILAQAGQSMLAQANQANQGVMSLIR